MKAVIAVFLAAFAVHAQTTACAGVPIAAPLTCAVDANGAQYITVAPLTYTIKSSKSVRGEVPARSSNGVGWTLIHQPIAGVTCWRIVPHSLVDENGRVIAVISAGEHQTAGVDYFLAKGAPYLTSPSWATGDVLACDYEW